MLAETTITRWRRVPERGVERRSTSDEPLLGGHGREREEDTHRGEGSGEGGGKGKYLGRAEAAERVLQLRGRRAASSEEHPL